MLNTKRCVNKFSIQKQENSRRGLREYVLRMHNNVGQEYDVHAQFDT